MEIAVINVDVDVELLSSGQRHEDDHAATAFMHRKMRQTAMCVRAGDEIRTRARMRACLCVSMSGCLCAKSLALQVQHMVAVVICNSCNDCMRILGVPAAAPAEVTELWLNVVRCRRIDAWANEDGSPILSPAPAAKPESAVTLLPCNTLSMRDNCQPEMLYEFIVSMAMPAP